MTGQNLVTPQERPPHRPAVKGQRSTPPVLYVYSARLSYILHTDSLPHSLAPQVVTKTQTTP